MLMKGTREKGPSGTESLREWLQASGWAQGKPSAYEIIFYC